MGTSTQGPETGTSGHRYLWLVIRVALIAGLAWFIFCGWRQAISTWYMRQNTADGFDRALRWDAANPQISNRIGTLIHMYADGGDAAQIVKWYETAARLSPL